MSLKLDLNHGMACWYDRQTRFLFVVVLKRDFEFQILHRRDNTVYDFGIRLVESWKLEGGRGRLNAKCEMNILYAFCIPISKRNER